MKLIYTSKLQMKCFFHSEECKEANLITKKDVETFLMDALKAEPQLTDITYLIENTDIITEVNNYLAE